ncbi:50S ribosomal protein L11 methyltransferase [uncultured Muribaculum sp.]|uniref:50S ribosomal protein L11 methyltransferase n=1 Tax=uncultured Muribaculum sp. TaxID=1918613 RepID=UPI0025D41511|nr:50S ribosomal protein L11 methyltransferase [uncultured Muribaculum sp.]
MNDYIELRVDLEPCSECATDVLAALLAENGYESFVPDEAGLTAYVRDADFNADILGDVVGAMPFDGITATTEWKKVEGRDWNAEWERNYFQPIAIDGRCVIHSSFHTDVPEAEYDIVIDPKMAFGTGHHQTTTLIIRHLLSTDLLGKSVIDVGTGTGILAILAAMRGATPVNAIEIDEFAHVNAVENVSLNGHPEINVLLGDANTLQSLPLADILLANINRNIILADLGTYARAVVSGGEIVLSGFYSADVDTILAEARKCGLEYKSRASIDDWTALVLVKS